MRRVVGGMVWWLDWLELWGKEGLCGKFTEEYEGMEEIGAR